MAAALRRPRRQCGEGLDGKAVGIFGIERMQQRACCGKAARGKNSRVPILGKNVMGACPRQRLRPQCKRGIEGGMEMGKELPAARRLVTKLRPYGSTVKGHQQKALLAVEMAARRFLRLGCGGEMDVAIREIDRGAIETAFRLGGAPQRLRHDLVDEGQFGCHGGPGGGDAGPPIALPHGLPSVTCSCILFLDAGLMRNEGVAMFTHKQVWNAIDVIAERYGFSASGLAKKGGT